MPTYDLLMLLVLVATTMFGFWKGMAWQIASLASLVVSYIAALRFSEQLAPVFGEHAPWNKFVAMLVIYIVTSFVIWTLFRLVSGAIDRVRLESFDRQLGALFGLFKGVLLCIAITFFAVTLLPPVQGEAIVASRSGRYIMVILDKSHSVFPPEFQDVVHPYLEKIEQRLNPDYQPHGQEFQANWPTGDVQPQSAWPQQPQAWPSEPQPQSAWPQQPAQPSAAWPQTPAWPVDSQQYDAADPYAVPQEVNPFSAPREPNPFPGPYSAEVPTSGTF